MDYVQVVIWAHQTLVGMQMLDITKVELELISDAKMQNLFFKKGVRDGVCLLSKKYRGIENLMTQNKNQDILYS